MKESEPIPVNMFWNMVRKKEKPLTIDINGRVYNLCFERTYDANQFDGNVDQWPIMDHNVTVFQNNFKVLKQQVRFIMSHTLIKCQQLKCQYPPVVGLEIEEIHIFDISIIGSGDGKDLSITVNA